MISLFTLSMSYPKRWLPIKTLRQLQMNGVWVSGSFSTAIVAAGNRMSDRAGTTNTSQLKDRLMFLNVEPNLQDTVAYFILKHIDERIVAFLGFKPDRLHGFNADVDVFETPRAWERASTILSWGLPPLEEREALNGVLGVPATTEFYAFLAVYDVCPNIDDLIRQCLPLSLIVLMLSMQCVHHLPQKQMTTTLVILSNTFSDWTQASLQHLLSRVLHQAY